MRGLHILQSVLLLMNGLKTSGLSTASKPSARASNFASNLPDLSPNCRRVYVLRHGMTEWNKRGLVQGSSYDIPLNDEGRSQARYAAEELSACPITCIGSSHLSRASQTADAVHTFHPSATRFISEGVAEINYGDLEGKCIHNDDEESKRLKNLFDRTSLDMERDLNVRYEGGENAYEVEKRTRKALEQILSDRPDDRHLVVVGHGRSNRLLLASLLYNDASKFSTIEQGNTAISIIDYDSDGDKWHEVVLNYVAHNEDRGAASGGRY